MRICHIDRYTNKRENKRESMKKAMAITLIFIGGGLCLLICYCVCIDSYWDKDELAYKTLYTISAANSSSFVEVRIDSSALSTDNLMILKKGKCIKAYNKHLYSIDKIVVENNNVIIYIVSTDDQSAKDSIILSLYE